LSPGSSEKFFLNFKMRQLAEATSAASHDDDNDDVLKRIVRFLLMLASHIVGTN
jgi:hypothetical protein